MNAQSKIQTEAEAALARFRAEWPPEWSISPSRCDWQVMIYGGQNPRTGVAQSPLEFQFFAKFYSRRQIEQRAADLCEREHRTSFVIREPTDARFMRGRTT